MCAGQLVMSMWSQWAGLTLPSCYGSIVPRRPVRVDHVETVRTPIQIQRKREVNLRKQHWESLISLLGVVHFSEQISEFKQRPNSDGWEFQGKSLFKLRSTKKCPRKAFLEPAPSPTSPSHLRISLFPEVYLWLLQSVWNLNKIGKFEQIENWKAPSSTPCFVINVYIYQLRSFSEAGR